MNGIIPLTKVMRNLERERIRQDIIKEWYQQRSKSFFSEVPEGSRNN